MLIIRFEIDVIQVAFSINRQNDFFKKKDNCKLSCVSSGIANAAQPGHLLPSIDIVQRLMKVFAVSADNLLNDSENSVVELQNHELNEQLMLINQLDENEKNALFKIINSMLTKKRIKDLLDGKVKM